MSLVRLRKAAIRRVAVAAFAIMCATAGTVVGFGGTAQAALAGNLWQARHSGKCLHIPNESYDNGEIIRQSTCDLTTGFQRFTMRVVGDYVELKKPNSDLCLDVEDASNDDWARVQQYECNGQFNQHWRAVRIREGDFHARTFVNRNSGKCMDVRWGSMENGAVIQQFTCNGTHAQQFIPLTT
jgi:hypothetical protein